MKRSRLSEGQIIAVLKEQEAGMTTADAAVAVVDQATTMDRSPIMDRLFQGIQHKAGMRRSAHPPAHDIAGVDVDHKGHVDEPGPRRDVGKI